MTWQDRAECVGADPEQFEQGGPDAADICRRCEVRRECFTEAMRPMHRHEYPSGYWAGTTDARRGLLRWRQWRPGDPLPEVRVAADDDGNGWALETFTYAETHGTRAAAARYGVHSMRLYRVWDRWELGRPGLARRAS